MPPANAVQPTRLQKNRKGMNGFGQEKLIWYAEVANYIPMPLPTTVHYV